MRRFLAIGLVCVAQAAPAQSDGRIIVGPDVCAALAALAPSAPAYMPGVDASGRAVAPADLAGGSSVALTEFPIEITADVRRRLGVPAGARLFQGIGRLGYVVIRDNKAYFNGQELTNPEQTVLAEACRRR